MLICAGLGPEPIDFRKYEDGVYRIKLCAIWPRCLDFEGGYFICEIFSMYSSLMIMICNDACYDGSGNSIYLTWVFYMLSERMCLHACRTHWIHEQDVLQG